MPTARPDSATIASGADLWAGRHEYPEAPVIPLTFPETPTYIGSGGNPNRQYIGTWAVADDPYYTESGANLAAAYARKTTLTNHRLLIWMHGSGGGNSAVNNPYGPETGFDFELHNQDAQVVNSSFSESWVYGSDGVAYPSRRHIGAIQVLQQRYPDLDVTVQGFALAGTSLGMGGAVAQTMVMPSPWRERIAFVYGNIGATLMRDLGTDKYVNWPADDGPGDAVWDAIDFEALAATDAVLRGMHYRHRFSSNDGQFDVAGVSTQVPWVNICESNKISLLATWVAAGHSQTESGVTFPTVIPWQHADQNVTLDRAHPCFTNSSGNYPDNGADRLDVATYPRGHYNLGLLWKHADIVDSASEIIFPIRYLRSTSIGGGIPDQPSSITVDVTPRRPKNFTLTNGETIYWSFDSGAQTGSGTVSGDVFTASGIALTSGDDYKTLRFYK